MATKDLYGIGKGSAQVVDLRPVNAMVQQRQAETIMRNQARQKQRATNAAAINSQIDKLKNTAWSRDQQYVSDLMSDTRSWMTDVYSKYGEMALADNPQLKREFDEKVSFIKRQNDASHANITMGNKMLEQRSHNLDDIDYESAKEFDKWLDLPPAERLSTPMPIIKDRELSILEVMEEEGVKSAIEGTYIETGGTGIKDPETGRYTHYTGNKTDMDAYNSHIDKYSTNKEGRIFRTANRMAMDMIDTNLYPTHIEENGEKVPNPEYQHELNRVRRQVIDDAASTWKKADEKKSRSYYGSTKGLKEEEEEDSGVVLGDKEIVTESHWSYPGVASSGYFDKSGKAFFKTNEQLHMVDGKAYTESNIPEGKASDGVIPIGTVIDKSFSIRKEGVKGLEEAKKVGTKKVISTGSITKTGKPKTYKSTSIYSDKGGITKTKSKSKTGKMIGYKLVDIEGVPTYIFEISDNKGNITDQPADKALKQTFSKEWADIREAESQKEEPQDFSKRKEGETWTDTQYNYKVINGEVKRKKK